MTVRVWGCARHAQIGPTCCTHSEILVTDGDRARVAAHTGRADFWQVEPPENPSYQPDPGDPVWAAGFYADGSRPVLKRRPNGDCTFLGPTGCTLPEDVRPLICRIFPYEYDAARLTGVSTRCPAEVTPPGRTILDVLGMDAPKAEAWRAQLYDELRTSPRRPMPPEEAP